MIEGVGGWDVLFGENGADTFGFGPGSAVDIIAAFVRGTNQIDLSGYGSTALAQLAAGDFIFA